jgi:hypothetical protein
MEPWNPLAPFLKSGVGGRSAEICRDRGPYSFGAHARSQYVLGKAHAAAQLFVLKLLQCHCSEHSNVAHATLRKLDDLLGNETRCGIVYYLQAQPYRIRF